MKVTARKLRNKGACEVDVLIFEKEWPKGVEITLEVLQRAAELELGLDWFARAFLPKPARIAYLFATAPARNAYYVARNPGLATFYKTAAPALWQVIKEYNL